MSSPTLSVSNSTILQYDLPVYNKHLKPTKVYYELEKAYNCYIIHDVSHVLQVHTEPEDEGCELYNHIIIL